MMGWSFVSIPRWFLIVGLGWLLHGTWSYAQAPQGRTGSPAAPPSLQPRTNTPAKRDAHNHSDHGVSARTTNTPTTGAPSALVARPVFRRYDLYLATMREGDWLFTYFGHNALRVRDRRFGEDINYNFGTFGFEPTLQGAFRAIHEYLQFKMKYWLGLQSFSGSIRWYHRQDRTYNIRDLYLTPQEAEKLVRYLRWHAREENRFYPYHHYDNNCSTKVRDALLLIVGPEFQKRALVNRGQTYRRLVMEKVRANPIVAILMDFGMGPPADKELTWWQEMFLPEKVEEYMSQPFWAQIRGKPLVGPARVLTRRKAQPAWWQILTPPVWIYGFTVLWVLSGFLLFSRRTFRTWTRTLLLMMGGLGLALFGMMVFSKFPEPPGNANFFFYHPFHWLVWWWMGKTRWSRYPEYRTRTRWYVAIHVVVAVVYLLLKVIQVVPYQINTHYILFVIATFGLISFQLWRNPDWGVVAESVSHHSAVVAKGAEP